MSKKRFTDINIWNKEWYMDLSPKHKCLIRYIFDMCDASGCWKPNWRLASVHINDEVSILDLDSIPSDQYEFLENGKIYLPDFISFQYGTLSEKSPAHNPIFKAIERNNLSDRVFNRVCNSPKEEEEDKDKEVDKDKEGEKEKIIISNDTLIFKMVRTFKELNPEYPLDTVKDATASLQIIYKICVMNGWDKNNYFEKEPGILEKWKGIAGFIVSDKWFSTRALYDINNEWQRVIQTMNSKKGTEPERKETNNLHARMKDLVKNNHG